jgi:hypothetical protein
MSASHLPEDMRQWPEDPHELLGIGPDADSREARKAYARLIRVYKPEHYPEQFRRIRDAYEMLRFYARFVPVPDEEISQRGDEDDAEPSSAPTDAHGDAEAEDQPDADVDRTSRPVSDTRDDEITRLYQAARAGRREECYRDYVSMQERQPGEEEIYVRLYWMLALWPQLDDLRDRCAWLALGLRQTGMRWRLLELYRNELEANPLEALSARCEDLLECSGPASQLESFVTARWRAAGSLKRWDAVASDVERLRQRPWDDDRQVWTRLLLAAIDQLAWDATGRTRDLLEACRSEVEEQTKGELWMAEWLSRYDYLQELAGDWRRMSALVDVPDPFVGHFRELLPQLWTKPWEVTRPQLLKALASLVEKPVRALIVLDRLGDQTPAALHQLGNWIDRLSYDNSALEPRSDSTELQGVVRELLQEIPGRLYKAQGYFYEALRPGLLRFCIREAVSVDRLVELLIHVSEWEIVGDLPQQLANDAPLHYLCQACLAFRN